MLALFTAHSGTIRAIAPGVRRGPSSRFRGLEPFHRLRLVMVEKPGKELWGLREASVDRVCTLRSLDAMEAAGRALGWVLKHCPAGHPEPTVFDALDALLGSLGAGATPDQPTAAFGWLLVRTLGWTPVLDRCVGCERPVPEGRSIRLDLGRGGVLCQACGNPEFSLSADCRQALCADHVTEVDAPRVLTLVEAILRARMDFA